jgi:hypothetical protein
MISESDTWLILSINYTTEVYFIKDCIFGITGHAVNKTSVPLTCTSV